MDTWSDTNSDYSLSSRAEWLFNKQLSIFIGADDREQTTELGHRDSTIVQENGPWFIQEYGKLNTILIQEYRKNTQSCIQYVRLSCLVVKHNKEFKYYP